MTPSQKSPKRTVATPIERLDDHAPTDWKLRKSKAKFPFDIVVITQTPIEAELDLMFEHGAEPAAKYHGDSRIYRLKDNRFAVFSLSPNAVNGAPPEIEFWNWWARTMQPSFADLTTATEIGHKIAQHDFMRQAGPAPSTLQ